MSTNLLVVDESKLQKPAPLDLREPAGVARVHKIMREGITLAESSVKEYANVVRTLTGEVNTADKAVAQLQKVGKLPADVASKLARLRDRLAEASRNVAIQERICKAKKLQLEQWMNEGDPTNAALIERDGLVDKAFNSVRRMFA